MTLCHMLLCYLISFVYICFNWRTRWAKMKLHVVFLYKDETPPPPSPVQGPQKLQEMLPHYHIVIPESAKRSPLSQFNTSWHTGSFCWAPRISNSRCPRPPHDTCPLPYLGNNGSRTWISRQEPAGYSGFIYSDISWYAYSHIFRNS